MKRESFFKMDQKKMQVTLEPEGKERIEGNSEQDEATKRKVDMSAPKMFAFNGLFSDDGQKRLSSSALNEIL